MTRAGFPVIAVVAPLLGSVAIGLMTGSPYVLMFAVLSPVIALATMLDSRRAARRHRRDEIERFDRECIGYETAITRAHAIERAEADARHPRSAAGHPSGRLDPATPIRIGTAPAASAVAPDEILMGSDSAADDRLRALVERARINPGLPALVARGPITVLGRGIAADALRRQLANELGVIVSSTLDASAGVQPAAIVDVRSATRLLVTMPGTPPREVRPEFASSLEVTALERQRRERATPALPSTVPWSSISGTPTDRHDGSSHGPIAVPIGRSAVGIDAIDLVRDGPHALVGGTTGSGKSEFLRALALGWAANRSPDSVQLLFVDFKGGSTFAGLTELPHAVGLITDLDPLSAERALRSLRAELRRREQVLAERAARDVSELGAELPRLVVLVDEFATLIETFPELQQVFADISARGRSLGVHLILCTQHPASVIRGAVAANCAIRISFRTTGEPLDRAAGPSTELQSAPPGRAVIVDAAGSRVVQIAVVDDGDVATVRARWREHPPASPSWLPALPRVVSWPEVVALASDPGLDPEPVAHASLPVIPVDSSGGILELRFGILDDPDRQRRLPAVWLPSRDGSLAIMGAARSGRSMTVATIAAAARDAGRDVCVLPPDPVETWAVLDALERDPAPGLILLADDLDRLVADAAELGPELLARWDAAVRAIRAVRGAAAAVVGSATTARTMVTGRFESRVLLRSVDADDHALAGAPRGLFDRAATAGRGWWADRQLQVAVSPAPVPFPTRHAVPEFIPAVGSDLVIATRRGAAVARAIRGAHPELIVIESAGPLANGSTLSSPLDAGSATEVSLESRVFIADPESWQAAWSSFADARRRVAVVLAAADASDVRALVGVRQPPPLDTARGDVWVVTPGEQLRAMRWAALSLE